MATKGYLGIDAGTQGLSVIFTDESLAVLAVGEGSYDMVAGLGEGEYEQRPDDWTSALRTAIEAMKAALPSEPEVLAIGISAQMHGEVLADEVGNSLGPARLWCDARNDAEGEELTAALGTKMPKRITSARWLWTVRNRSDLATQVAHITTPAGWLAYQLTGEWNLGIGDAAGMFPIAQETLDYDQSKLKQFDTILASTNEGLPSLGNLLPAVRVAGQASGVLNEAGSQLLGLAPGIPVAAAEGDQPAALAGSLIGEAGMVSCSFGTSVCANSVGDRAFSGVSQAVDHFCAPDGKPINMVWLRNGTTYMNCVVEMFGAAIEAATGEPAGGGYSSVMPLVVAAEPECGGILALPFMDDEPGLGVARGGTGMLVGLNNENGTPGNAVKAAILSTMFNLRLGSEVLDTQGYPRSELILTGGLTKTPELAQVLADVFNTNVSLLASAEEGTAWGAALLAKYRHIVMTGSESTWADFLGAQTNEKQVFEPSQETASRYEAVYQRYQKLLASQNSLDQALAQDE